MTRLFQFQIKTVSWSGHSFVGFTETEKLVTYKKHESKDFKLNVADMEILKNNKYNMFKYLPEHFYMPNMYCHSPTTTST